MSVGPSGDPPASGVFVGRAHALAELDAALDAAERERGGLVLVSGDPGIGKTRLVNEVAVRARARGVLVLRGRCWGGVGAPAYWPWAQVFRAWMRAGVALADVGVRSAELAAFLPELGGGAPAVSGAGDAEGDRFRLFDALVDALLRGAEGQPMLVVLDDLHWADVSSVLALRFLAGEVHDGRLLVVGTYRDLETHQDHPLGAALGDLARSARLLPLSGLTRDEVARFIAIIIGVEPEPGVVDAVFRQTGGNPLFVRELVRLAWQEGAIHSLAATSCAPHAMPAGVREVIARRLDLLDADVQVALEAAAVEGETFSSEVVARTAGLDRRRVLGVLQQASDARLIAADPGAPGRYWFAHALIRDVVYQALPAERLAWLHGRTGEAIEELYGDAGEQLPAIASHYVQAAPLDGVERAWRYAQRAGERAMVTLAWEEAGRHFEQALAVLDLEPDAARVGERCELHLALGRARARAGETQAARRAFRAAADLARSAGDAVQLATAALGLGGVSPIWGIDSELAELLEQARDALGEHGDPPLRARVFARMAQAQYYLVSDEVRDALSRQAAEIARDSSDDRALADALTARRALWGPGDLPGRTALTDELQAVARRLGDPDLDVCGRAWRVVDFAEAGDLAAARVEIRRHAELAGRLRQPSHLRDGMLWRAMEALLDGRFEDAEALAEEALAAGQRIGDPGAHSMYTVQKVMILAQQGGPERLDEAAKIAQAGSQAHPDIPAWRALLAFAEARAGRLSDARADLERVAADGFTGVPRDAVYLVALAHSADAAASVGHRAAAASLRPLLTPYADRWVVIDRGLVCLGSTERLIGLLDGVLGDVDASVGHLERALASHVRAGASAFVARNRRELASALLVRRGTGDADRAAALLDEAEADACRLGMPGLLDEIMCARSGSPEPSPSLTAPDSPNLFLREGEFWTLTFAGRTVLVGDAKGLRDIVALLAHPGRETHALELMGAADTAARGTGGEGLEMIDAQARRAYRARLADLPREIEEAEANADVERAARARAEMEFVSAELAAALGMGGRARRQPDAPERARKAVTWRIRAGIERIEREHPELGRHLRHAIRTGAFCSYNPERPTAWRVQGAA